MELVKKIRPKNPKKIKTILNNKIIKQKRQKKKQKTNDPKGLSQIISTLASPNFQSSSCDCFSKCFLLENTLK
jgi:hypothetical protein